MYNNLVTTLFDQLTLNTEMGKCTFSCFEMKCDLMLQTSCVLRGLYILKVRE